LRPTKLRCYFPTMCAIYTYNADEAKLKLRDQILVFGALPHGEIRPTDLGPAILPEFQGLTCLELTWGWSVPWDKKPFINAKSETLTKLALYRPHLEQRCLLLADGFYEGGARFSQSGGAVFCFAGLWRDESGVKKYTLLTTTPNESVAKHHDRMPFIVKPVDYGDWLGGDWLRVLSSPDHAPLEKFQKQPELF
jgi:putative SOS response-associated peptidase YedK